MAYKLTYFRVGPVGFNSKKQEYEEGEPVTVTYYPLGTDTSYSFEANADDVKVQIGGNSATITFTMPAHDVEVTCSSKSTMGVGGLNNNLYTGSVLDFINMTMPGMPVQNAPQAPVSASEETVANTEWICPNCQTKNSGKFCGGCGTPRQ